MAVGALLLDLFCCQNEILGVRVVLLHTRCDRQNVQIEDDIFWREIDLHQ